jgi:protein-disulfide isomerase
MEQPANEDGGREQGEAGQTGDPERRPRARWKPLAAIVVAAVAVVGILIAVSAGGSDDGAPKGLASGTGLVRVAETERLLAGIPQDGLSLGDPEAPVTVVEFVDLQCPFCGQFARESLADIVERYVRPGKVRLELRPVRFIGPDSARAALAVAAAADQDRAWQFSELFFHNQGVENSGYVTPSFIRRVATGVEGLDVDRLTADMRAKSVERELDRSERLAARLRLGGTPSFYAARGDGELKELEIPRLSSAAVAEQIDELLAGREPTPAPPQRRAPKPPATSV